MKNYVRISDQENYAWDNGKPRGYLFECQCCVGFGSIVMGSFNIQYIYYSIYYDNILVYLWKSNDLEQYMKARELNNDIIKTIFENYAPKL